MASYERRFSDKAELGQGCTLSGFPQAPSRDRWAENRNQAPRSSGVNCLKSSGQESGSEVHFTFQKADEVSEKQTEQ